MKLNDFYKNSEESDLISLAKKSGTTLSNLQQVFLYGGAVSGKLALRISKASKGQLTVEQILSGDLKESA